MSSIIIIQEIESLKLASEIIEKIFSNPPKYEVNEKQWNKWRDWFFKQNSRFIQGKTSQNTYFTQIMRIQQFLLANTPLTVNEIFEMEVKKREKQYDVTSLNTKKPLKLTNEDIDHLIQKLFNQLSKKDLEQKKNPTVEKTFNKYREKLFGRKLLKNLEDEITQIKNSEIKFDDDDHKYMQLSLLYLQLDETSEARKAINKISIPVLKYSIFVQLAAKENDFHAFEKYIKQAFPESFEPITYGPYILAFLIGNNWNYRYELNKDGIRCISLVLSSGIIQLTKIAILNDFIRDVRISPDGRLGLWIRPIYSENDFLANNIDHLSFKQVIGWMDVF